MDICRKTRNMLFERGAVQFGGFRLKLHDKNPSAPLSPYFFNMRTPDNPKPGPLMSEDCDLIAGCVWNMVLKSGIAFTAACPIPNAGRPIVEALKRIVPAPRGFQFIPLDKIQRDGGRKIIPRAGYSYRKGELVLLIDDLITKADTKFEAIESLEQAGCTIAALAVLIDREQGGVKELEARGYKVLAALKVSALFQDYCMEGKITQAKLDECLDYMKNN